MTVIANAGVLVNRLSGGNNGTPECAHWWKDVGSTTMLAGCWSSAWLAEGAPGPGVAPTVAANPDRTTPGAFRMTNPGGGRQRWLRSMFAACWTATRLIFYDRLFHIGGLSGIVTTAQAVGGAVTRYANAASVGNFALAEVYTTIGTTATTLTIDYVDSTATTRTSPAMTFGAAVNGRSPGSAYLIPYNVAAGANGVHSVTSVTLAGTTGTAGNFGITICRPLLEIDVGSVDSAGFGHGVRAMPLEDIEMVADACVGVIFMPTATTMSWMRGNYVSVEA